MAYGKKWPAALLNIAEWHFLFHADASKLKGMLLLHEENHAFSRKWHQNARKASKRMIGCKRMSYLCCANGKDRASEQPGHDREGRI